MSENKFHKSKQPIALNLVNVDEVVVFDKFKDNDDGFKYFIGYKEGKIVKPFCIILPKMSGYIKYFENGGKNMSFVVKNDMYLNKHNGIQDKIKNKLNIKFHIKAKVRKFDGMVKAKFLGDEILKEIMYYACIVCITIDPVMRMNKRIIKFIYRNANIE